MQLPSAYIARRITIILSLLFLQQIIFAQANGGFETGFVSWTTTGKAVKDSMHAKSGKYCAKIEGRGSLSQKIFVTPFSILQFSLSVKCSKGARVYSFIRFFDRYDHALLSYKSEMISDTAYKETGNYTEVPPGTKYMYTGVSQDSSAEGLVYVDDFHLELNIGSPIKKHPPQCNLDEYMRPLWDTDTIFNETVLLKGENAETANGQLLFTPEKILSVKSFNLQETYVPGKDYRLQGKKITRMDGSKMPYRADSSFDTKNDLAWYNLQSQWIVVSYTHRDKWQGVVPAYRGDRMPHVMARLRSGQPLKIIAYGMSITRGLDVSGYDTIAPYMPTYIDLFARELKKTYRHASISMYNAGLPGALVSWGAEYADKYVNPLMPDLAIIDFGMNDFWRYSPGEFKAYIQAIISKVKKASPKTEFLLLSNITFDPDYVLNTDKYKDFYLNNMIGYNKVLKELEETGIIDVDMTSISETLYHTKKAKDCLVNPLHPNDYLARWYAQVMAAIFVEQVGESGTPEVGKK